MPGRCDSDFGRLPEHRVSVPCANATTHFVRGFGPGLESRQLAGGAASSGTVGKRENFVRRGIVGEQAVRRSDEPGGAGWNHRMIPHMQLHSIGQRSRSTDSVKRHSATCAAECAATTNIPIMHAGGAASLCRDTRNFDCRGSSRPNHCRWQAVQVAGGELLSAQRALARLYRRQ